VLVAPLTTLLLTTTFRRGITIRSVFEADFCHGIPPQVAQPDTVVQKQRIKLKAVRDLGV
jgi:hypothetical protein